MSWNVEVNRVDLLTAVKQNREKHADIVHKALDRYREAVIELLEERIQSIKDGSPIDMVLRLPQPEDHTTDYDTIIGMLEMSTQELVSLGPSEYRSYVQDKWDWSQRFAATNASYGVGA